MEQKPEKKSFLANVPGFRHGKLVNKIVAVCYYLMCFAGLSVEPITALILFAAPFGIFYLKDNMSVSSNVSEMLADAEAKLKSSELEVQHLSNELALANAKLKELNADEYLAVQQQIEALNKESESMIRQRVDLANTEAALRLEIVKANEEYAKLTKQVETQKKKLVRIKELYKGMELSLDKFYQVNANENSLRLIEDELSEAESLAPTVTLKLHAMDIKELRKTYNANNKQIDAILKQYEDRYTTKANAAIYRLMVLALRAELQNILYNLKYEKLDTSVEQVKVMTDKYLKIAAAGNQSIAGTLVKFIGQIEQLFINAVKIEYNYYVKKEQARQEQLAIRQQMREEAEERRVLEEQRKQIEKEESKYTSEIEKLETQLQSTVEDSKLAELQARIAELQAQLQAVSEQKEEILQLQNGKAGNVYIISNLGSFGENVFKVGMTRRLDPMDRVNELGDASVPFKFDVHSFIFSDNAVDLEKNLHERLNAKRLNKVNIRKEFFNISIDELEALVTEIEPTAEFNRTMLAEEYRQSLSSTEVYSSEIGGDDLDEDENEE